MHYSETFNRSRSRVDEFYWRQYKHRHARQQEEEYYKLRVMRFFSVIILMAFIISVNTMDPDRPPLQPRRNSIDWDNPPRKN